MQHYALPAGRPSMEARLNPQQPAGKFSPAHFLTRLALSLVAIFVSLLLLEAGTRVFNPQDLAYWDSRPFRRIAATSPHFIENIPNTRARFIGVPVRINSMGLRGDEIAVPKSPNSIRVLAVGDSITFGYGVPVEQTYSKVLEKQLNETAREGIRYEVLNAGTLGGSLGDYLHFLNQKAEVLQPDVVIIGLTLNDILVYSEAGDVSEAGAEWHGDHQPLARRASQFLLRHSQLYMLCYSRMKASLYALGAIDMNKVQGSNYVALAPPSRYQAEAWQSSEAMLSRIVAFCREHGYRLVVVVFPMQMQISPAELQFYREKYHLQLGDGALSGEPQQRLRQYAAMAGITLVDALPAFRKYDARELFLSNKMIPSDPTHPSAKGHQIIADEILRVLAPSD